MSNSGQSRQRLKPWLEGKIESGTIPGLCWLDRNQKIFRIPWKRNGTSEWAMKDSAIFRDWAIHTGKFREGVDKIDYPYWKTRLRCALNKHQDIVEHKNLSNPDGNDPYRVYQISDNMVHDELLPTQDHDVEMTEDFKSMMDMNIGSSIWNSTQINLQNIHNTKEIYDSEDMSECGTMDSDLKKISTNDLIPMSSEEFRKLKIDFEVIIRFQTEELSKTCVKECCFLTTCNPERALEYQVIKLPEMCPKTEEIHKITSVLWPNMKDGIYIKIDKNKNILAQRLCKCRIYYCDQRDNGLKLERSDGRIWTTIFSYEDFLEDFKFRVSSIKADVTLYIGQKGDLNPYNVFYSVTICHLLAKQSLGDRNICSNNKISLSI